MTFISDTPWQRAIEKEFGLTETQNGMERR
jgi:hypothetical protein